MGTFDKIHDNRTVIPVKKQEELLGKFYNVLGTTQILNGSQLVYDFYQKVFHGAVLPLELATGGEDDDLIPGGRCNWYPGSYTYGYVLEQDAPVWSSDDETDPSRHVLTTVFKHDINCPIENSGVKILTVLDDVNTDHKWQGKLKIYYKIITHDGITGYIHAQLINKIVYKNC